MFKSIVYSEAIRMRQLNESTDEYLRSLQQLKTKCLKSNFNLALVSKILKIATTWQNRFSPDNTTSSQQVKSKNLFGLPLSHNSFPLTNQKKAHSLCFSNLKKSSHFPRNTN